MAQSCGLTAPQAIMRTAPETGELLHMFKSGKKIYIWNHMDGAVWEITKSRVLGEILEIIRKKDITSRKAKAYYFCATPIGPKKYFIEEYLSLQWNDCLLLYD